MQADPLRLWNNGNTKRAIVDFVNRVSEEGSADFVRPEERIAVFDNDGTLWCEKPMPIQADFILGYLAEMAEKDPNLREQQPWKAAREKNSKWLGDAINRHYNGDESQMKLLIGAVEQAFGGMPIEDYETHSLRFLATAQHPTLHRLYHSCIYAPMRELLDYLNAHGLDSDQHSKRLARSLQGYLIGL